MARRVRDINAEIGDLLFKQPSGKPARPDGWGHRVATVQSDSNPLEDYHVRIESNGRLSCDCKGFHFAKYCKHCSRVLQAELERLAEKRGYRSTIWLYPLKRP